MTDLVERLRAMHVSAPSIPSCALCSEAADEIERLTSENGDIRELYSGQVKEGRALRAENERLRAALERIATRCYDSDYRAFMVPIGDIAHEALAAVEGERPNSFTINEKMEVTIDPVEGDDE